MTTLEVTITHTDSVTTAVERYVSQTDYKSNGGRRNKGHELYTLDQSPEQAEESKRCSIANSKRTFKGIIYANYVQNFSMITLTFKASCDFDTCRDKFNLFWMSLKRCKALAGVDLRYVGAIEFQKNGRIHFYIEFKNLVSSKWKYGGMHYEFSHGSAEDTPKIASYLNKGIHDDQLPLGKKHFLSGRGLDRPVVMKLKSRKIIYFFLLRNGHVLQSYESKHSFHLPHFYQM